MQSLCTLRNHRRQWPRNTRYQADATPYLGRTFTGWIRPMRPKGEIARPTKQERVERIAYVHPGVVIAGRQQISDLCLESLHALLGYACV